MLGLKLNHVSKRGPRSQWINRDIEKGIHHWGGHVPGGYTIFPPSNHRLMPFKSLIDITYTHSFINILRYQILTIYWKPAQRKLTEFLWWPKLTFCRLFLRAWSRHLLDSPAHIRSTVKLEINSLRPSDAIWRHTSGSTLTSIEPMLTYHE